MTEKLIAGTGHFGNGETTVDGAYWPTVNGEKVGENGRTHWHTEAEALAVANRIIGSMKQERYAQQRRDYAAKHTPQTRKNKDAE